MRTPRRTPSRADLNATILFRVGKHRLAVWARDVQEIRNDVSLDPAEIGCPFVLYAHRLFNMASEQATRLIVLQGGAVGIVVDGVDRMLETGPPRPLPRAFQGAERSWYLGLVDADGMLVPLVNPETLEGEAIRQERMPGQPASRHE